MNLKFGEKKTTKTENKASTFEVSEEKTVNKLASLSREGDRTAVEGVAVKGVPSLASTFGGAYFPIYHFMTKVLGLGGAKLLVYALIYSFTVNDGSFFGSRGYIAEACGIVMSTTSKVLSELLNDGLIERLDVTSFGTVSYRAKVDENGNPVVLHNLSENRDFENRHTEKETPPIRKSDTPRTKIGHNNKDYTKTTTTTTTTTAFTLTREETEESEGNNDENNSFHRDAVPLPREGGSKYGRMSPSPEGGGYEGNTDNVRVILEGENKAEEVEKLIQEIEAGKFHGDIKVPGDPSLEDELIQRKHGILRRSYNKEFDLRETFDHFGDMERVLLTNRQYEHLTIILGKDVADEYIQRLDYSIGANPKYSYHSHYKTILKWLKEDMSCADAFAPA